MIQTDPAIHETTEVFEPVSLLIPDCHLADVVRQQIHTVSDLHPSIKLPQKKDRDWQQCNLHTVVKLSYYFEQIHNKGLIAVDDLQDFPSEFKHTLGQLIQSEEPKS